MGADAHIQDDVWPTFNTVLFLNRIVLFPDRMETSQPTLQNITDIVPSFGYLRNSRVEQNAITGSQV